jgi:Conjugal transfer protein
MRSFLFVALAATSLSAFAQTTNFNQVQHIETALDHLTVIDLGEPVVNLAIALPDAFEIERHDDKVFIRPLRSDVSTNLFIWTSARQLCYEIDPAGDPAKMNVIVRNAPQPVARVATAEEDDRKIQKIASLVLTQALMGTEDITHEKSKAPASDVLVELNQVLRSKTEIYIRYTVTNQSKAPFRLTTPDVYQPAPTQVPISVVSLRNHQLSSQTFAALKPKQGPSVPVAEAESQVRDLQPGQKATGVISIHGSQTNPPQLYQLRFGSSQTGAITVETVL